MLSIIGSPAEGCVDEAEAVDWPPKSPPRKPRDDSRVELGESLSTYSLLQDVVEELDSENVGSTGLVGTVPTDTTLDVVDSISTSQGASD